MALLQPGDTILEVNGNPVPDELALSFFLAEGNVDQMISLSCADWEQNARLEFDAFAGVQTELGDLQCTSSGKDGDVTLVTCTGEILATYGNEQQNFDLGGIDYRVVQEAGEWRMCGY